MQGVNSLLIVIEGREGQTWLNNFLKIRNLLIT